MRHEYAVLGPSVNLVARLMCSTMNPDILVSSDVRSEADTSYGFKSLGTVKAKGYTKPVHVYEPLSVTKKSWGGLKTSFVGREEELKKMNDIALDLSGSPLPSSRLILVSGESGIGKALW